MTPDSYVRVLSISELPPGGGVPVEAAGKLIAVFNVDGAFHAIDNECPHKGASLADGALTGSTVTCPMHRWQFRLEDGRNPVNPELCVRRFPVEIRDGAVWVDPN
jgi:NAD(P)H-dependent nitrite reductase small subunit